MLDYFIVGHGLAGAVLSRWLLSEKKRIMVINQTKEDSSSMVAGGLYNPITGRKMVRTWEADQLFPIIEDFYKGFEEQTNAQFLNRIGIYRPFFSNEEQNDWQAKVTEAKFSPYIAKIGTSPHPSDDLNDEAGGLFLKKAGWVNVARLLKASKNDLVCKGSYMEELFNETKLVKKSTHFEYGQLRFKKLIFCTGYSLDHRDKFFDWLPYRPVKGELLTIELEKPLETIYNRGIFMLPLEDNICRVGATYNWKDISTVLSSSAEVELKEKIKTLYKRPFKVIGQQAGIRPATKDRRPFIGTHPDQENVYMFGGFGSKGVSLVPFFGKQFVEHLEHNKPLHDEVNINRYFSLYYNQQDQNNG